MLAEPWRGSTDDNSHSGTLLRRNIPLDMRRQGSAALVVESVRQVEPGRCLLSDGAGIAMTVTILGLHLSRDQVSIDNSGVIPRKGLSRADSGQMGPSLVLEGR